MRVVHMSDAAMRICIFTRSTPAHQEGKATFHQDIIGPRLSKRGHQITIITTGRKDGNYMENRDGLGKTEAV